MDQGRRLKETENAEQCVSKLPLSHAYPLMTAGICAGIDILCPIISRIVESLQGDRIDIGCFGIVVGSQR